MAESKTESKTKTPAAAAKKPAPAAKVGNKPAAKVTPITESTEAPKGTRTGVVDTDKRDKTRKVVVSYLSRHPKYGKYVQKRTVLHVHDENNLSKVGDVVEVAQCRPLSKTKNWKLVRIVEKRSDIAAAIASAREVQ